MHIIGSYSETSSCLIGTRAPAGRKTAVLKVRGASPNKARTHSCAPRVDVCKVEYGSVRKGLPEPVTGLPGGRLYQTCRSGMLELCFLSLVLIAAADMLRLKLH